MAAGADQLAIFGSTLSGKTTLGAGTGINQFDIGLPDGLANGNQFNTGKLFVKKRV